MIFSSEGDLLDAWSDESRFGVGPADRIRIHEDWMFLVDDGGHVVEKLSLNGDSVLSLGQRDRPAKFESGDPLNRPTDIAVHAGTGDLFVTDGYGNSECTASHPAASSSSPGASRAADPGQLQPSPQPHRHPRRPSEWCGDRENFRIQIFDPRRRLH